MAVAAGLAAGTSASAAVLAPNGLLNPAPNEANPVGGSVIATSTVPFTAPTFNGTLTSQVISGDTSNPLGGLTFTYRFTNAANSDHGIGRFTVTGYATFLTDASYNGAGAGVAPTVIDRPGAVGDVIGFTFSGVPAVPVPPGSQSFLLVVQTNAPLHRTTIANFINGSVTSTQTFGPVPTPGSAAAMGLGLLALAGRRRRHA